jgi:hypothetical protein
MKYADIILGVCTDDEKEYLFSHLKQKCMEGQTVFVKKTNTDEYYLSVPVYDLYQVEIESPFYNKQFYYVDLYAPNEITCITYSVEDDTFISNIDTEGCICTNFFCENVLQEITLLPDDDVIIQNELDLMSTTKRFILGFAY